ncbi:MAG: hypothetical protein ISS93_00135 [Candidatus Aenigmarchaeota archaeon]|nr:hypothetical protein [Candidatus Aenigmarchaeota archaeon]
MVSVPSCPLCAGRRPFCIHKSYPFPSPTLEKDIQGKLKKDFFGPSYSVFIGRRGYPNILAGPMLGIEPKEGLDSPSTWFGMDYSKIIELRSFLLRSKKVEGIRSSSKFVQEMQELALAKKPADVETSFRRTPQFSFSLSESFQPMGPSGLLEKMRVTDNVSIPVRVERIVSDELKAGEQAFLLYQQGMDVYRLASILSSGTLGLQENKKLVPSRWSVTGVDDIIAKKLMSQVRTYPSVNDYIVFESQYLDNHFVILMMPGSWEFENFEAWAPGSNWSTQTQSKIIEEYEPHHGRTSYAESQAGGYYAARLPAVRYLDSVKRQARVISFREVGEGYSVPLGVWVVRQTAEHAFKQPPKRFATIEEALNYCDSLLRIPIQAYKKQSRILQQRRLTEWA